MSWQPLNLTEVCATNSSIAECSPFTFVYLNLLVQLYSGSRDDGRNCTKEPNDIREEYDFIVVGAGSAGCVVANRLSENPNWKVLLLEAGSEQPDVSLVPSLSNVLRGSQIAWTFRTAPNGESCLSEPGQSCPIASGKTMGGSSSLNAMLYIRGNKADYDGWAAQGNEGWSYEDVLPFFKKSEKNIIEEYIDKEYHGYSGELYVDRFPYADKPSFMLNAAFNERGLPLIDFNGPEQVGTMQGQTTSLSGERVSSNTAFIQPIRCKRKNLTVKTNSEVLKIFIDENKKAYGIIYSQNNKTLTAYANKEVIVSAGALNSPRLLMLSGVGPKEHLEKLGIRVIQDIAVGENLHDHVSFNGIIVALSNETTTLVSEDEMLEAIEDYANMKVKRGPLSGNGPTGTIAFMKTDPDLTAPDVEYTFRNIYDWRNFFADPILTQRTLLYPTAFYDSFTPRVTNIAPKSRGVLLLNETNPTGPAILHMNYLGDERDLDILLKGLKYFLSLEDTEAFKSAGAYFVKEKMQACRDYEWGTDEYFICIIKTYTSSIYHPVGSCKMGPKSDEKAVVDNELSVYGVCGLRVIDASIMPDIIRGNTNAPAIMIGERGADFIMKYWRQNKQAFCP